MGMYYGDNWNPENDWSYQGLPVLMIPEMFGDNNEVKTDYICVYDDGRHMGIEPTGSTPTAEEPKTTHQHPLTRTSLHYCKSNRHATKATTKHKSYRNNRWYECWHISCHNCYPQSTEANILTKKTCYLW